MLPIASSVEIGELRLGRRNACRGQPPGDCSPMTVSSLMPLFRELNDLKRIRVADKEWLCCRALVSALVGASGFGGESLAVSCAG